jgi:hypothetical protein
VSKQELVIVDARGDKKPVDLSVALYKDAAEAGLSLGQHMANVYPTNANKDGTAMQQVLEQCGIFVKGNKEFGIRASSMDDILNPKEAASAITRDGIPASRLLFPAVILDIIEDKLQRDYSTNPNALTSMVAVDDSIQGDRWERPVLNFDKPEEARSAPVSQLSLPNSMLTITASDKTMRIPNWAIGMTISEQALKSTTLDLVGLAVSRQAAVEGNERANGYILSLLQGDTDYSMVALSAIAGKVQTAVSLDSAASAGLTQKAWLTWLSQRSEKRVITHVVTDLAGAMAIESRVGKPVVVGDNPTSVRIDTLMEVINPMWPAKVKVFLTNDVNWPAKTIMGIDQRYAIHRVNSLTAQYSAIEQFVLKRATSLRIDKGEAVVRLFDEAFEVLTYA